LKKSSLLPKFAIERPVTISVTLLAILVIGFIAFQQVERKNFHQPETNAEGLGSDGGLGHVVPEPMSLHACFSKE